jgi:hypothetical protein
LVGDIRAIARAVVRGADPEDTFPPAQLSNPNAVAAVISVTRMAQAARMRMHNTQDGKAAIRLTNISAANDLAAAIKLNVTDAGVACRACGQRCQHYRFLFLPQTEQHPACFFVATAACLMGSIFVEERPAHAICDYDAPQRLKVRGRCSRGTSLRGLLARTDERLTEFTKQPAGDLSEDLQHNAYILPLPVKGVKRFGMPTPTEGEPVRIES